MNLRKLTFKILRILVYIFVPLAWLTTTNSGLNAGFIMLSMFSPVSFNYSGVNGKMIGAPVTIKDLVVELNGKVLRVGSLTIDWQYRTLNAINVLGAEQFLPNAEELKYQTIILDHIFAQSHIIDNKFTVQIQTNGQSLAAPLRGNFSFTKHDQIWDINYAALQIGHNNFNLAQNDHDRYKWHLDISQPQLIFKNSRGTIIANGGLKNFHTTPECSANLHAKHFVLNNITVNNLQAVLDVVLQPQAPIIANISADQIQYGSHQFSALQIKFAGDVTDHQINSAVIFNGDQYKLQAAASLDGQIWHAHKFKVNYAHEQLSGVITYDFLQQTLYANLDGMVHLGAHVNFTNKQLHGKIKMDTNDLAFLMQWMPDVTRLKGKFNAQFDLGGTLKQPEIITAAHITDITATLPVLGIKIKPMELHLIGDAQGKFNLTGRGNMRRGSGDFSISGFIEPFKAEMPNSFTLIGSHVEFINNQMAHLIASNKLKFHYAKAEQRLDIQGDIEILQGNVTMADKRTQTVKTKDVVFVNEAPVKPKHLVVINPDINLRIAEGVHFNGFGLDAAVSGKLNISHRHNAMYADGRVTIKEGSFQLPGQKLDINHGRLLYPPGTLLVNPMLDIKMLGKTPGTETSNDPKPDLELIVQGTAQKPRISETGLSGNKDRAISQALLTGSSVLANDFLHEKLKISEIGLASRDNNEIDFFDDHSKDKTSLKNKDIVLGRSLGRKFYLQYLHSIGEANKRVRLKYNLTDIWAIGVESGTLGGGADISFTIERD